MPAIHNAMHQATLKDTSQLNNQFSQLRRDILRNAHTHAVTRPIIVHAPIASDAAPVHRHTHSMFTGSIFAGARAPLPPSVPAYSVEGAGAVGGGNGGGGDTPRMMKAAADLSASMRSAVGAADGPASAAIQPTVAARTMNPAVEHAPAVEAHGVSAHTIAPPPSLSHGGPILSTNPVPESTSPVIARSFSTADDDATELDTMKLHFKHLVDTVHEAANSSQDGRRHPDFAGSLAEASPEAPPLSGGGSVELNISHTHHTQSSAAQLPVPVPPSGQHQAAVRLRQPQVQDMVDNDLYTLTQLRLQHQAGQHNQQPTPVFASGGVAMHAGFAHQATVDGVRHITSLSAIQPYVVAVSPTVSPPHTVTQVSVSPSNQRSIMMAPPGHVISSAPALSYEGVRFAPNQHARAVAPVAKDASHFLSSTVFTDALDHVQTEYRGKMAKATKRNVTTVRVGSMRTAGAGSSSRPRQTAAGQRRRGGANDVGQITNNRSVYLNSTAMAAQHEEADLQHALEALAASPHTAVNHTMHAASQISAMHAPQVPPPAYHTLSPPGKQHGAVTASAQQDVRIRLKSSAAAINVNDGGLSRSLAVTKAQRLQAGPGSKQQASSVVPKLALHSMPSPVQMDVRSEPQLNTSTHSAASGIDVSHVSVASKRQQDIVGGMHALAGRIASNVSALRE